MTKNCFVILKISRFYGVSENPKNKMKKNSLSETFFLIVFSFNFDFPSEKNFKLSFQNFEVWSFFWRSFQTKILHLSYFETWGVFSEILFSFSSFLFGNSMLTENSFCEVIIILYQFIK